MKTGAPTGRPVVRRRVKFQSRAQVKARRDKILSIPPFGVPRPTLGEISLPATWGERFGNQQAESMKPTRQPLASPMVAWSQPFAGKYVDA